MPSVSTKILLNDNIHFHSSQRGVVRYFHKLTDGLIAHFGKQVIIFSPEVRDYGQATHIRSVRFRGSYYLRVHDLLAALLTRWVQPRLIYSSYFGLPLSARATVATVYDLNFELFPESFLQKANNRYMRQLMQDKRRCLEQASLLLAISQNTAKDIARCYPTIPASKVIVTYPGIDAFFFETDETHQMDKGRPFLLYVGQRSIYKNFLRFLHAFGQSGLATRFDLRVILPTGASFTPQETECLRHYQIQDAVSLRSSVSEALLRESYAHSYALVYPSEYEGFGFPILEAMASGTLIAASNTSSLPEVGGKFAFYFNPQSEESIVECLRHIAGSSTQERQERVVQGRAWARTFTWERCQQQTIELLRHLL